MKLSNSATSNPTGLKEIDRKDVVIVRVDSPDQRYFRVDKLNLSDYKFVGDEKVSLIARAGPTSLRFELGIVSEVSQGVFSLEGLDFSHVLSYRILIYKEGSARLLATAENLRNKGDGDVESLLPIVSTTLGQRLWAMVFNEDGPVLRCNERVFPNGASAEAYSPFRTLVLPEALRQVLEYIATDSAKLDEEGTVWADWGDWMREKGITLPPPQDDGELKAWLEESIGLFCDNFKSADDLQQMLRQGEES